MSIAVLQFVEMVRLAHAQVEAEKFPEWCRVCEAETWHLPTLMHKVKCVVCGFVDNLEQEA